VDALWSKCEEATNGQCMSNAEMLIIGDLLTTV